MACELLTLTPPMICFVLQELWDILGRDFLFVNALVYFQKRTHERGLFKLK